MQTTYKEIRLSNSNDPVNLYSMGDFHIGHINFDEKKYLEHIKIIEKDPHAQVIFMGDNVEGRDLDHKFFDLEQCDPRFLKKNLIMKCYRYFEDSIKRLMLDGKVLGVHIGNHIKGNKSAFPYVESLCESYETAYLGYRAISILRIRHKTHQLRRVFTIFSHHGSGGGRKSGAKINRIEDEANSTEADIYIQGHNHFLSTTHGCKNVAQVRENKVLIKEKEQVFVNSGSYLKSYQEGNYNYSEKFSFKPQPTGCIMLSIEARKGKITPYILK